MNDLESAFMILWRSIPRNVLQALLETFLDACDEESIKLDEEEIGDEKSDEETSDEGSIEIGDEKSDEEPSDGQSIEIGDEKSDEETSDEESIEIGDEKSDEKNGDEKSDELFPEFSRAHAYIDNNKNISYNKKYNNKKKKEIVEKKEKVETRGRKKAATVDSDKFVEYFNNAIDKAKSTIPKVTKATPRRCSAIAARAREFGKEALQKVVDKAVKSDFLNGRGCKSWVACFDWIMRPNNFAKVLDGNYDNDKMKPYTQTNSYNGNDYRQQIYDRRRGWDAVEVAPEDWLKGYRG